MIDRPSLTNFGLAYVTAVVVLGALDAAWLGGVAKNFYRQEVGPLLNETPQLLPAAVFYLLYPLGLVYLVLTPFPESMGEAALRAASQRSSCGKRLCAKSGALSPSWLSSATRRWYGSVRNTSTTPITAPSSSATSAAAM